MENPFEIIIEKLDSIEALLTSMSSVDKNNVTVSEIINVEEAAKYLSSTKSYIYKQTSQNKIPHYKSGKKIYFKRSELEGWVTKNRIWTTHEIEQNADKILRNSYREKGIRAIGKI